MDCGSQDEEGLALMMEAMHKIQDDFEKIIGLTFAIHERSLSRAF